MVAIYVKTMLAQMMLIYEAVGVVIANDGRGLILIDDFSQLNEKSVEGLLQVLRRYVGDTGGVSNPGVSVSAMAKSNLQGVIYHIKYFNHIGRTCKNANVELTKFCALYH